ncbi:MAG: tRNA lysidine(34) synthetase TilS [Lachnospiraceae bacterium]
MYQRVKAYIREQKMLKSGDRVIAGVSGGADSICLLFILLELKKELGFELMAVHVHHGLRGSSADADEEYVKKVCRDQKVRLFVFHEDVAVYAKNHHLTPEEAGREVRRKIFMKVLEEQRATCIALAHHQNDNAETFLWNLCRGSGLKGLRGILPKNGVWIRPLLCLTRKEIESYLEKRGISYCTDETNLEDHYTRNRIRNHVIPYLEENVNCQTVSHITESMRQLESIGRYIEKEVEHYEAKCIDIRGGKEYILNKTKFDKIPEELKPYVIYHVICSVSGKQKDITSAHVRITEDLLSKQVGKKTDLPYDTEVLRCYEGLSFRKKTKEPDQKIKTEEEQANRLFDLRILEKCTESKTFPENTYTKWFDYDIIKNTVKIRHRMPGDYIVIDKNGRTQKLKQYFINEKIPRNMRDSIWLVADGQEILWIVGYRQSQAYQIHHDTKRILEIKFYGGKEDGRACEGVDPGRGCCKEN